MNSYRLLVYGALPIRILAGITVVAHGLPKLANLITFDLNIWV
jgi:hypothetical protein